VCHPGGTIFQPLIIKASCTWYRCAQAILRFADQHCRVPNIRAAIYARVSTKDKGQDTENQLAQLRRYAESQNWTVTEYIDHETGRHANRAQFRSLFEAASRREINMVLVWALDRFTREGVAETFLHIRKLSGYGVQFESLTESHFRTTGPAGELMIAVAAWIAKQERARISERTKAGLARAKAKGKQLGRRWTVFPRDRAEQMRKEGKSWRVIAQELGVGQSTIRSGLAHVQQTSAESRKKVQENT
jgi:DNA invertase Pin-like site-specific DNA recombinase